MFVEKTKWRKIKLFWTQNASILIFFRFDFLDQSTRFCIFKNIAEPWWPNTILSVIPQHVCLSVTHCGGDLAPGSTFARPVDSGEWNFSKYRFIALYLVVHLLGAVEDVDHDGERSPQVLGGLCLASTRGTCWTTSHHQVERLKQTLRKNLILK